MTPRTPIQTFRFLMKISALVALVAIIAVLVILKLNGSPLPPAVLFGVIFGVGVTILVAGALMALMFYSSSAGQDDRAGGRRRD